jgi:hypothetical protein
MSIDLPRPIAAYFEADKRGAAALSQCFTGDAVVKDEGRTWNGLAEIQRWKADAAARYSYISEPFSVVEKDGRTIVASRVTGSFPGSPIDLRYIFRLEGTRIAGLEIVP